MCYTTLNLCLLAIEQRKYEGGDIFINPKEKVINPNAIGMKNIIFHIMYMYIQCGKKKWDLHIICSTLRGFIFLSINNYESLVGHTDYGHPMKA